MAATPVAASPFRALLVVLVVCCLAASLVAARSMQGPRGREAVASFAGRWSTSWGPMELEQTADGEVEGSYGFGGGGSVEGNVDGDSGELTFHWRSAQGRTGDGTVRIWEDGRHFTGEAGSAGKARFLGAYRVEPRLPVPEAGETVSGQTASMLRCHVHAPNQWNGIDELPAIVILHGSNMSARAYVETIVSAWPELAARYLIVGFDGERLSSAAEPGDLRYNYTYINFSGPGVGPEWVQKQSPGLVASAMEELREAWPITRYLVGGHSQGGFLSWVMALHFPELVTGAFPMSCNLLVQCDPDYFDDAELREAQRAVALAPIHGRNDPVVPFTGSRYARARMLDGGFPRLRLFDDPRAGHMFARLPVADAVDWIEQITSDDAETLIDFAEQCLREEPARMRDAVAALDRAADLKPGSAERRELRRLTRRVEDSAEELADELLRRIRRNEDGSWADDFLAFRADFAHTEAARPVMAAYAALRERHAKPAEALYREARKIRDDAARKAKYAELVEEYYASKWYEHAREWMK